MCGWVGETCLYKSETVYSQFVILVFHQGGIEFFFVVVVVAKLHMHD